jgi:vacuolar protein sorting-associated protein 13D
LILVKYRDVGELSLFLHVEIVLEGATFYVIFTDASGMPPPLRIDNYSEVPIMYHQNGVTEPYRQSCVRPHSSLPYAWDEPMLEPELNVIAPGDVSSIVNMNVLNYATLLTYENFLYLALTCTFSRYGSRICHGGTNMKMLRVPCSPSCDNIVPYLSSHLFSVHFWLW